MLTLLDCSPGSPRPLEDCMDQANHEEPQSQVQKEWCKELLLSLLLVCVYMCLCVYQGDGLIWEFGGCIWLWWDVCCSGDGDVGGLLFTGDVHSLIGSFIPCRKQSLLTNRLSFYSIGSVTCFCWVIQTTELGCLGIILDGRDCTCWKSGQAGRLTTGSDTPASRADLPQEMTRLQWWLWP